MPLPLPHVKELRRSLSENGMYITAFPFTFNHHNYIVLFEDLRQLNEGSTYYGARITFIDEQDNQRILRVQLTHSHPLRSGILALCNKRWLEAFLRNRVEFTAMLELTFDLLNYRLSPLVQQFQ